MNGKLHMNIILFEQHISSILAKIELRRRISNQPTFYLLFLFSLPNPKIANGL